MVFTHDFRVSARDTLKFSVGVGDWAHATVYVTDCNVTGELCGLREVIVPGKLSSWAEGEPLEE